MNAAAVLDPFTWLASLGYGPRLIPIIPPNAEIAPNTRIWKRLQAGDDARGKAPGRLRPDGMWEGLNGWQNSEASAEDLARWAKWRGNAGVLTGRGLAAIDADALDEKIARRIHDAVENLSPGLPCRIGRYPKALYLVRIDEGEERCPYMRVSFGDWLPARGRAQPRQRDRIEVLTLGKQFVAAGAHPSGPEYTWRRSLIAFDDLPVVTIAALRELLEEMRAWLPQAAALHRDRTLDDGAPPTDQQSLRAPIEDVRRAVAQIRNGGERWVDREEYVALCYAIRAATDGSADGLEIWRGWCARWEDGDNDADVVDAEWARCKPPFRRGFSWLAELAEESSGGAYRAIERWHEAPDLAPTRPDGAEPLATVLGSSLAGAAPAQKWHVKNWIPWGQTTLLSGDGGVGKSLIALQLGIDSALGRSWFGEATLAGRTLFLTAEDEIDELHRRQEAILRRIGADAAALADRLHLISLHGEDAVIATADPKNPLMLKPTRLMQRLDATLATLRPALAVLDTQADLFGGDEIKRTHARQFIGYLQRLAKTYDCTVLLLAHPSLQGMSSGSGTSGNTAWHNSVRSRLYLTFEADAQGNEQDSSVRVLTNKKANRGERGLKLGLRWQGGQFELSEDATAIANQSEDEQAFLRGLKRLNDNAEWVTLSANTRRYAPRTMTETLPAMKKIGSERLAAAMHRLLDAGRILQEPFGAPSRPAYRLIEIAPETPIPDMFG